MGGKLESKKGRGCKVEKFAGVLDCTVKSECDGVYRDTKSANRGTGESDMGPVVIVPPEIHPLFHLKDVITPQQCAHTLSHTRCRQW